MLLRWAGSALCPLPSSNTLGPSNTPAWSAKGTLTGGPETLAPGGPTGPVAPFTPGGPCGKEGTKVAGAIQQVQCIRSGPGQPFLLGITRLPCALQLLPGHSEACRPSARGGRGSPWYPSLRGQVVPEVLEAPADRSTVSCPLSQSGPFLCQPPPGPRQTYLNARKTVGSRLPLNVRKGRLVYSFPSQPAPLADLAWGGVPDSSKPRRAPQGSERRGSMPRSPTEARLRLLHTSTPEL